MKSIFQVPGIEPVFNDAYQAMLADEEKLKRSAHCSSDFYSVYPRALRLLLIRFRLAMGLEVSYNTAFTPVKGDLTIAAYRQIIKCNELWFAYESLIEYAAEVQWKRSNPKVKSNSIRDEILAEWGVAEALAPVNAYWISRSASWKRSFTDLCRFMSARVDNHTLRDILAGAADKAATGQALDHKEITGIIYASRNLFVHLGETARAGTSNYSHKTQILKMGFDYLAAILALAALYAVKQKLTTT